MKGPDEKIAGVVQDLRRMPDYLDKHLRRELKGEVPLGLVPYADLLRNPVRIYDRIIELMRDNRTEEAQALYNFLLSLFEEAHRFGVIDDEYFRFLSREQLRVAREQLRTQTAQELFDGPNFSIGYATQLLN